MELFGPSDPRGWEAFAVVNDDVMGGVSTSRVAVEGGALVFAGTVSLENDGGFASMRAPLAPRDLRGYTGIELAVRGDGRRYKLTLRDAASNTAARVLHRAPFDTHDREMRTLRIPFEAFEAGFRGQPLPDAPPVDRQRISELGVLIADRQAGDFRLELHAIRAYAGPK